MRVGIRGADADRDPVVLERVEIPAEIVMDVTQVEVRLEALRIEMQGALVERLRLDELVAPVVDV